MAEGKGTLVDWLWELFYPTPRICPICGAAQPVLQLCADCQAVLARKREDHGQCQRCGTFGLRANACDNCRDWPQYLRHNYSAFPYTGDFRQVVLDFKYRGKPWLARALAQEMVALIPAECSLMIPVPLHKSRLRERGFNQSELLAKALSQATGLPYDGKILLRVANTPHQTGLSRQERMDNLRRAFMVRQPEKIIGQHVLVIDDVFTTGTTIAQCAKTLHQAGAKAVTSLTIASGMK